MVPERERERERARERERESASEGGREGGRGKIHGKIKIRYICRLRKHPLPRIDLNMRVKGKTMQHKLNLYSILGETLAACSHALGDCVFSSSPTISIGLVLPI